MQKLYKTSSIQLAAYLCSEPEIKFLGSRKSTQNNKIIFLFEPAEIVQDYANSYFNGEARVSARTLFQNYRMLKDLIFENMPQGDDL